MGGHVNLNRCCGWLLINVDVTYITCIKLDKTKQSYKTHKSESSVVKTEAPTASLGTNER